MSKREAVVGLLALLTSSDPLEAADWGFTHRLSIIDLFDSLERRAEAAEARVEDLEAELRESVERERSIFDRLADHLPEGIDGDGSVEGILVGFLKDAVPGGVHEDAVDRIAELEAALRKFIAVGHNDDCIFCGLKDRIARGLLALEPAKEASYREPLPEYIKGRDFLDSLHDTKEN